MNVDTKFQFQTGQRVRVAAEGHPMDGQTGVVWRVMLRGGGARGTPSEAWVRMDNPLPPDLRTFPAGDSRADMASFYDFECMTATPDP